MIVKTLLIAIASTCAVSLGSAQDAHLAAEGTILSSVRDCNDETVGGIGSGLAYDVKHNIYLAVSDRGPGDGTIDYRPRFDSVILTSSPAEKGKLQAEVRETTLLKDREGRAMTGLIPDVHDSASPLLHDGRVCIDPEAIALAPDATIYVADEYGPFLYQFKHDGTMLRSIKPPENYLPRTSEGKVDFDAEEGIISGRVPNHGFEGVALSPDGRLATAILQNGLLQDGGKDARFTRIIVIDLTTGRPVAEYAYELIDAAEINTALGLSKKQRVKQNDLAVSEITAVNDRQFLVLERDNSGANGSSEPKQAIYKCVYLVDLADATNLLSVPNRPYGRQPKETTFRQLLPNEMIKPVKKTLVVNFASSFSAVEPKEFGAKWEGLALTPRDANGRRTMVLACDNDFLNPTLQIGGREIVFSRAKHSSPTQFLLFELELP